MPDCGGPGPRERLAAAFDGPGVDPPPLDDGDSGFGWVAQSPDVRPERLVEAAVLVPLIDRPGGMTVLLTRRTPHLRSHAGQVSFPGGRIERGDATAEAAALREAEEEVGLDRGRVEVLGRLGRRATGTGFRVTPVVGLVRPPVALAPDAGEVEAVFEMPLSFALDRANHRTEVRLQKGVERSFHVVPYRGHYVWGLTARLLVALADRLGAP